MKYCVLITDGAAGLPLPDHSGKTSLELAGTPYLDAMAKEGVLGLARTVPPGMEPSSACACMSVIGYDPVVYYKGRAGIEAKSMGVPLTGSDITFRCNLVATSDGIMRDHSSGHISTEEACQIIESLNDELGSERISFFPGISYRHICRIRGQKEALKAVCTPPHDIPGQPFAGYLPKGEGSEVLLDLMERSKAMLASHPVVENRKNEGKTAPTMIWLFWGTGAIPELQPFREAYGLSAAMTSGVDLLQGLAIMAEMTVLTIPGVSGAMDNDYTAQAEGAIKALEDNDLVVIHIEAPDEAGHAGSIEEKVNAIECIDREVVARLREYDRDSLRILVMPDHPTPIEIRTHTPEPVPFMLWGEGFAPNGAGAFSETEAARTGLLVDPAFTLMSKLVQK